MSTADDEDELPYSLSVRASNGIIITLRLSTNELFNQCVPVGSVSCTSVTVKDQYDTRLYKIAF